ncbi:MAG: hypothetical protein ACK539_12735 [Planctomycetota bacterium]
MTAPARRFVAVGASNLARMALALLDAERAFAGGPVHADLALGRGRAYGMPSLLLARGIDGLLASRVWQRPAALPRAATTALLMDVGNDLLYGAAAPQILAWVDEALARLCERADRVVVVGLPIAAVRLLPPWRFHVVRRVLVPSSRLTYAAARDDCERLHDGLRERAAARGARFCEQPLAWFGLDPMHVRRSRWRDAAASWLDAPTAGAQTPLDTHAHRLGLLLAAPDERRWFGRTTRTPQPARRYADGSTLALW